MAIIYATPDELAAYMDPDAETPAPIANATMLLRSASALVEDAIQGALYHADDDTYLPTDTKLRDAVRDATCEQAQAWSLNGIDPRQGAAALKPIPTTKALGGASVSYGQSAAIQDAIVELASGTSLTSAAWRILDNAGLISNRVATGGSWGRRVVVATYGGDTIDGGELQ